MAVTVIQWTWRILPNGTLIKGYTFNPWWGCLKVSEECHHCYAEDIAHHYGHEVWGPASTTSRRVFREKHWQEPRAWNRQAKKQGHRRSVFCASIILPMSPWGKGTWPDNVWVGTSVGVQKRAEERVPYLLEIPAVVRFLSCEPLLGSLDLSPWISQLQWVISGGESGYEARPMNMEWPRSLRDQCQEAQVPYFFKQIGGRYHDSGGRELDGRTWDEIPPEFPIGCLT